MISGKCKFCHPEDVLFETSTSIIKAGSGHHHGHLQVGFKRHVEDITELTDKEFISFCTDLLKTARVVKKVFSPDKINYQLLGNWEQHVHWQIYPRYKSDPDFGQPPIIPWKVMGKRVPAPRIELDLRPMSEDERRNLVERLKSEFEHKMLRERREVPLGNFLLANL